MLGWSFPSVGKPLKHQKDYPDLGLCPPCLQRCDNKEKILETYINSLLSKLEHIEVD